MSRRPEDPLLVPPILSALLLALAQPPFALLLLPFLSLVPLAAALGALPGQPWEGRRAPVSRTGQAAGDRGRKAAVLGAVFGLVHWGLLLVWIPLEVGPWFWWAYPGYLGILALLVGLSALLGWATHHLHRTVGLPLALAFPVAWVGVEWIRAHFPFGLAWPWLGLATTLTPWPALLGLAEWTGERGVAFWIAGVNALVAGGLLRWVGGRGAGDRPGRNPRLPLGLAGLVALVPALLGVARARTLPLEPGPRVALVGTGLSRDARRNPLEASRQALVEVREALASLEGPVDLVLLPEATVAVPLPDPQAAPFLEELVRLAGEGEAPVVAGALARWGGEGPDTAWANGAFLLAPGEGIRGRYLKTRLVPGMEQGRYRPGPPPHPWQVGEWAAGPLICYESLFGELAREYRRQGARILVNLTSDVWFGEGRGWWGRIPLHQHPAHLVLRAVENRVGVARAANGGYTLALDPLGRPLAMELSSTLPDAGGGGVRVVSVPLSPVLTLYTRTGDLVGPACVLLGLAALLVARRRRGATFLPGPEPWGRKGPPGVSLGPGPPPEGAPNPSTPPA